MTAYTSWAFEVAWSNDADDPSPTWVNMTSRVDGTIVITHGRTEETPEIQPGTLVARLTNNDGELTAGNTSSSLYGNVTTGKMCRLVETVGANTYCRFFGYLTDQDPSDWVDSGDAWVDFTFTDVLDRLNRSEAWLSTLTTHVLGSADDSLLAYLPLNDEGLPFADIVGGASGVFLPFAPPLMPGTYPTVEPRGGPTLPGDDVETALITLVDDADPLMLVGAEPKISVTFPTPLTLADGDALTLVVWLNRTVAFDDSDFQLMLNGSALYLYRSDLPQPSDFTLIAGLLGRTGTLTTTPSGVADRLGAWYPMAIRFDSDTDALELWIDDQVFTTTMASSFVASVPITSIGTGSAGAAAHLQLYIEPAATSHFDHAAFLAQRQVGLEGLARQLTGERVASLAAYAGITATDIDDGTTLMQIAQLAGKSAGDAMQTAATTENGDLFAATDGTLTFRARTRRYNLAATATIQKAWIDDGLRPRVDGPVINVFDATINGGPTARSRDAASIAERKVYASDVTIDAALMTDAADAAKWRTYNYAVEKTRVSRLPIDLLHAANATRDAVLALEIGDRADLSGMAAKYPVDAGKLIIEGWVDVIGIKTRTIAFVTSPVLGATPGTPDTWFKLDDPTLGQLDAGNPLAY